MRKLICGDNLDVLRSGAIDTASVDLVYLDPPFNSNQFYNLPFTRLGKDSASVEAFKDIWHWDDATRDLEAQLRSQRNTIGLSTFINDVKMARGGEDSLSAYLVNMAIRLYEISRVMKNTASIYLHCDPQASHYLKVLMDSIFGSTNFLNEVIWKRTHAHGSAKRYGPVHDVLLFYSKSSEFTWTKPRAPHAGDYVEKHFRTVDEATGHLFSPITLTGSGVRRGASGDPWRGINPTAVGRHWAVPGTIAEALGIRGGTVQSRLDALDAAGRVFWPKSLDGTPRLKWFVADLQTGVALPDIWTDIPPISAQAQERLGYPTQKPIALLDRIISASSRIGAVVFDPFCGCGTSLHSAEGLHRNWIGIDISRFSVGVVKRRLVESFDKTIAAQIVMSGVPTTVESASALARENPWEFEKWACGQLGAKGLYKRPGDKGSDGGIDGVIEFYAEPSNKSYAIVQVKGGTVKPNDVKALYSDVENEPLAAAGVFVCFDRFKTTATNSAIRRTFTDHIAGNEWPVIQVLTIEDMLRGAMPRLPNQVIQQGYRASRLQPSFI